MGEFSPREELKQTLAAITTLKQQQNHVITSIINKLQLLTVLPFTDNTESNISIHKLLLDNLLSENAQLAEKVTILKEQFQIHNENTQPASLQCRKKLADASSQATSINLGLYQTDDGLIENTFLYQDSNLDGTSKSVTRDELDLHNFQLMFRHFLSMLRCPNKDYLGPILNWKLCPVELNAVASMSGPEDSSLDDETFGLVASGKAVSLYPHCKGRPYREGDPICDRYHIKLFSNAAIICMTDGCNWGDKPRRASRIANRTMVNYVQKNLGKLDTVQEVLHMLVASMADAQLAITDGPEETWGGGKTTANIGVLVEVDQNWVEQGILKELHELRSSDFPNTIIPTKWVFICVNIGDCKVLHFSNDTKRVYDVTAVSRNDYLDPTDPGGRLGPYKGLWPDTRNVAAFWIPVREGDIIASMSDGVHDNLDPQIQGLSASQFDSDMTDWDSAPAPWVVAVKQSFLRHFTEFLVNTDKLTPKHIKDTLIDHCIRNSERSREYLATNPQNRTPGSYNEYPGKLDHTTVACFRVGLMNEHTRLRPTVECADKIKILDDNKQAPHIKQNLQDVINAVKEDLKFIDESGFNTQAEVQPLLFPGANVASKDASTSLRKRIRSVRNGDMLMPFRQSAQMLGSLKRAPPKHS